MCGFLCCVLKETQEESKSGHEEAAEGRVEDAAWSCVWQKKQLIMVLIMGWRACVHTGFRWGPQLKPAASWWVSKGVIGVGTCPRIEVLHLQ